MIKSPLAGALSALTLAAGTGAAAADSRPNIVFMDMRLPKMDGLEAARRIAMFPPTRPPAAVADPAAPARRSVAAR